jgi:hypothetical protein
MFCMYEWDYILQWGAASMGNLLMTFREFVGHILNCATFQYIEDLTQPAIKVLNLWIILQLN